MSGTNRLCIFDQFCASRFSAFKAARTKPKTVLEFSHQCLTHYLITFFKIPNFDFRPFLRKCSNPCASFFSAFERSFFLKKCFSSMVHQPQQKSYLAFFKKTSFKFSQKFLQKNEKRPRPYGSAFGARAPNKDSKDWIWSIFFKNVKTSTLFHSQDMVRPKAINHRFWLVWPWPLTNQGQIWFASSI